MSDKLLGHFEKEMAFINQSANEFARKHPAAASKLMLSGDTVEDPLVARLFSGFAYLNARIQQKLSDDFPELTDAMLETLYPHYLRPIPSFCMLQFEADPKLDDFAMVAGGTVVETDSFEGQTCRFTTNYPVSIAPFKVTAASLLARPFIAPGSNEITGASSVIKLSLKTLSPNLKFSELAPDSIRFFLKGLPQHINPLYELLLSKSLRIVVASSETDPHPIYLDPSHIQPVGFKPDQALLPYPDTSFSGYRLLTEYFTFPEKFQFVEFVNLASAIGDSYKDSLNIYIYLSESDLELEHQLDASMFALGCTPAINLFRQVADPITLSHTKHAYRVVADARRTDGLEIYSIDSVGATDATGKSTQYRPFYGTHHGQQEHNKQAYWFAKRSYVIEGEHLNEEASEVDLSLVDLEFSPYTESDQTLDIQLLCSNRNLPKKLATGQGQPLMQIVDGDAPIERISCVVPPTATIRPPIRERGYWRLISHLNLNHLSLANGGGSPEALKEILRLYDFKDSASSRKIIDSILRLQTRSISAPIQIEGTVSLCRGTEINLELDAIMLKGTNALLFASVLERFLALYCSINSFTQLKVSLSGKDGVLKRWSPRAGEKALI